MKPASFRYHRPDSLDEALQLAASEGPDARPLAGGQSLIPAMNFRLAQPAVLIDLARVDGLDFVESGDSTLRVGAMTRQSRLERELEEDDSIPALTEGLRWIAHPQIRSRGTIGGSLAHADPAAELPALALALDARFRIRSGAGDRRVEAADFFLGLFLTALQPGELLTEIEFPVPGPATGTCFDEFARRHGDYALAGAAAVVTLDDRGRCQSSRLVLLNCGDTPIRVLDAEAVLAGERYDAAVVAAAGEAARQAIDPPADLHASTAYRRHLAGVLAARTLRTAWQRAEARSSR